MENIFLVLTAAIVIGGEIAVRGEVVEVTKNEARDLLNRGKARMATEADGIEPPPLLSDPVALGAALGLDLLGTAPGNEQTPADTSAPETPPEAPAAPAAPVPAPAAAAKPAAKDRANAKKK